MRPFVLILFFFYSNVACFSNKISTSSDTIATKRKDDIPGQGVRNKLTVFEYSVLALPSTSSHLHNEINITLNEKGVIVIVSKKKDCFFSIDKR